jgi:Flp pilus assembly protein TadD
MLRYILLLLLLLCAVAAFADVAPDRILLLRGVIALKEGRAADAVDDLREAADLRLEDWQAQMLYGQALAQAGQTVLASGQLRQAILLAPTRLEPWRALAQFARDTNDPALELFALSGIQRFFPEDPQVLKRLADVYTALKQPALAEKANAAWENSLPPLRLDAEYTIAGRKATITELRAIIQESPNHPAALPALANEEWKAGSRDTALQLLQKAFKLRPNDPSVITSYAYACFLTGKADEALRVLREAAPLGDYALDHALANWCLALGKYAEAVPSLQRMLLREPVNPVLNRQLGVAALLAGDTDTALSALRVSWMKLPDPLTAQHYVTALVAAGREKEAEELLLKACTMFPQESLLKLMLALRYRDTDRLQQAVQLTLETAKVRPEAVQLTILAGERYYAGGYLTKAYETAALLRDNYANDVVALQGAVQLFRRLGAFPEAKLVLTRLLSPNVKSPLGWTDIMLEIANAALESNQQAEANIALTEVFKHDQGVKSAYVMLGKLRQQQRQWSEATRLYQQALTRWPQEKAFLLALARTAREAGDYALAQQTYARARLTVTTAEPWLESAEISHNQGDVYGARELYRAAQTRPGGSIRARLALLISYEGMDEPDRATESLEELKSVLSTEREQRVKHWQDVLADYNLTITADERNALLLMDPTLIDPEPLTHWRKPEKPQAVSAPAPKPVDVKPAAAPKPEVKPVDVKPAPEAKPADVVPASEVKIVPEAKPAEVKPAADAKSVEATPTVGEDKKAD